MTITTVRSVSFQMRFISTWMSARMPGIERAERLVEQQDLRLAHQGLRQSQPLLHAAGKRGGIFVLVAGKADGREQRARLLARGAALGAEQPAAGSRTFRTRGR